MKSPEPPRPEIQVLRSRWMQSIRHTRSQSEDRTTLNTIVATPNFYVPTYCPQRWQTAVFPILCKRLKRYRSKIAISSPITDPNLVSAESVLGDLEFGGKVESPLFRLHLRRKIVSYNFSPWAVRQAFNSAALKRRGAVLALRRQPSWLYRVATFLMWAAVSIFVCLFGITFIDVLHPKLTQQSIKLLFLCLNACVALMSISYTLGPQWKRGQEVLEKLIGA